MRSPRSSQQPLHEGDVDALDELVGLAEPLGAHRPEHADAAEPRGLGGRDAGLGVLEGQYVARLVSGAEQAQRPLVPLGMWLPVRRRRPR